MRMPREASGRTYLGPPYLLNVLRRPDIATRPLVLAGSVADKREQDGQNVVELEVVTLAEGEPSVQGSVQVVLPSQSA
jgi:hypothetical protein